MSDDQGIIRKTMKFGDEEIAVAYREATRPEPVGETAAAAARRAKAGRELPVYVVDGLGDHPPLNQRTYEIAPGITCEQDVADPHAGRRHHLRRHLPAHRSDEHPGRSSRTASTASARTRTLPRSSGRRSTFPTALIRSTRNSKAPTRSTGATKATPSSTTTRVASATPRATSTCGALAKAATATT